MRCLKKIAVCVFLCLAFLLNAQQYNFKTYSVKDGLAHSQVSQIIQDKDGYLWFSLFGGGISKFDGKSFTNYSEKDGLASNLNRPIIKDKNNILWIGALGGEITKFDNEKFTKFKPNGTIFNQKVYTILQDYKNEYWFGTDSGIYKYNGIKLIRLGKKDGLPEVPIMCIFQDSKKRIWIAAWEKGIYCFDNEKFYHFETKDGLSYHTQIGINESKDGTIWFSSFKGVSIIKPSISNKILITHFNHPLLDSTLVYKALDNDNGTIYFATNDNGLLLYDYNKNSFENITTKNGLPNNLIYNVEKDKENNIWISCWGFGVLKFSGKRFIHYTIKEGLNKNIVTAMNEDNYGNLIIGTGSGLNYLNNNVVTEFMPEIKNENIFKIVKDKIGSLWISTNKAIYHQVNGKTIKYTNNDGIQAFPASAMACDKTGNMWFGSWSGGVTSFDGKEFKNLSIGKDGVSSSYIYSIYPDINNDIWICTWDGGLTKISNGKFTYLNKTDGLINNNVIDAVNDLDGNLWIATYGGGIARYDGKNITVINSNNGLSDDVCNGLAFDDNDNLWIATSKGLDKLNYKMFNLNKKISIKHYGIEEGFTGIDCLRNALFKDSKGNMWFGTKSGLTKYTPSEDHINNIAPQTHINSLKLFFEKADFSIFSDSIDKNSTLPINLKLPYDKNHLTFSFIGVSFTNPETVQYSYFLEGSDKQWSPFLNKTEATYSGLAPGKYCFMVNSITPETVSKQNIKRFYFEILPPWYKTWWAYSLYSLLFICIYIITVYARTRKLKKEKESLELIVKERTFEVVQQKHIIEEKHKEIKDSINYAERIQRSFLASEELLTENLSKFESSIEGKNYFVFFQPKDIVSGDFYWASKLTNNNFALVTADSTGHGVPGAIMSMLNISSLEKAIEKGLCEPSEILNHTRKTIIERLQKDGSIDGGKDGMDCSLICFDFLNKKISYTAANNPIWIVRKIEEKFELIELAPDKMPVGKHDKDHISFTQHEFKLLKGDLVYTLTDGMPDQFGGPKGKKFMYKQLKQYLISISQLPLNDQKKSLDNALNNWKGNLEQVDDICIIGIRI